MTPPAASRTAARTAFLEQYRSVRDRDGYRVGTSDYYRALPWTPRTDPQHLIWTVRQRSYERFRALVLDRFRGMVLARFPHARPAILDLGAGNGWLSHRMTVDGCRTIAVDICDDDRDGLGAGRHYGVKFGRVVADFDALPFSARQFQIVVFNGSLHYSPDVRATLARVAPLLAPGGVIAVIDSPMFACPTAGQSMRDRMRRRFQRDYGVVEPIEPGEGFLLFSRLGDVARDLGLDARFFESRGGVPWIMGRLAGRIRHGIRPAAFGVWWAA